MLFLYTYVAFLNICFILFFILKLHYITLYTDSDYPFWYLQTLLTLHYNLSHLFCFLPSKFVISLSFFLKILLLNLLNAMYMKHRAPDFLNERMVGDGHLLLLFICLFVLFLYPPLHTGQHLLALDCWNSHPLFDR